jgi:hypothetical protein
MYEIPSQQMLPDYGFSVCRRRIREGITDMYARFFSSHTTFLSRFGHCRWLLLSFILGSSFCAADSKADDPLTEADLSKIEITLQRSACYGVCPEYEVTIHGDGRVIFTASASHGFAEILHQGVVWPGTHEDRIDPRTVAALFKQFQKAGFFDLRSSYRAAILHGATYVLTVDTGRRHKSVEDYVGQQAGMPRVVTELEDAVDKVAGTDRWLRGTGLIAWLEGQHFDFHSPEAAQLAVSGANSRRADEAMVPALIDHGAPLDSEVSNPNFPRYTPVVAGFSLMESAIQLGQLRLFNKLVATGWVDRVGKARVAQLFARYAAGCSPVLVDAAADAGIDIDEPDLQRGRTALANLANVATAHLCGNREAERLATAQRLLARGANPNHRDNVGQTPLFAVPNPDMVDLLQAHGAKRR